MSVSCWVQGLDLIVFAEEMGQPDLIGGDIKEIIFLCWEPSEKQYVWNGHGETLEDDGNILYFVLGGGNMRVYIHKNASYTLKSDAFYILLQ